MPRPGQPPPSTLRNRNRITNKTRLKIVHGNIDVDQIIPDEDEEKNRLLQSVAGVDQEDANEHHLQAVLSQAASQAASGKAIKNNEQPAAFIPIPEHSGFAENYTTLYPADRWKDPVSYIQSSSVIEEYTSAALAGCTYYMDERDKEWLDRNNEEARGEGTSAQGSMLTSGGRVSARSIKGKGKEIEDVQPSPMSEDEFELLMGLFEKVTQEKTEFLHHSLESGHMHFPEFSEYQEVLSLPLPPATFASYCPPTWLPQPPHLLRLARIIYPYWKERCLERAGRRIIPTLNFDEADTLNESYVCFRRRETKAVRKTRASQATSSDKLTRLQSEFEYPLQLATHLLAREQLKRDSARQSHHVWNLRMRMVDMKMKNPALGDKVDEELLIDKERPTKKTDSSSRVRLAAKSETSAQSSTPARDIIRPKERLASYQGKIEQMLQMRKDQDLQWEDHVDIGYVQPTITPYGSRLFKYISAPRNLGQSSVNVESVADSAPKRPIRLRYGRGGRTFIDRRLNSSHTHTKWRRRITTSDDEEDSMKVDDVERDEETDRRLTERWRYDTDDGPPYGPNGADEQDRALVDDFDSKFISNLLDQSDLTTLMTDFSIPVIRDGKKESYTPYRLGMTPPMMPITPRTPSQPQGPLQGVTPVSQQVHAHQSVPISQQLKLPSSQHTRTPGSNQVVASIVSQPPASNSSAQSSVPRPPVVIPSPQVTHNGRPAMNMPRVDMMKLAFNHSVPPGLQPKIESLAQPDNNSLAKSQSDDHQIVRPQSQQQVPTHSSQQDQAQSQISSTTTVNGLHPTYAALANANPAAYNIPHYIPHYPVNPASSGLNNQQLQHLKSVFNTANAGGSQNYNTALYSQLQMPKTTSAVVNGTSGVPAANGSPNIHNYTAASNINLQLPPGRSLQRGNTVNGTSSSPPRPASTVNGVQHDTSASPSPHMIHALVPGDHIPTRTPSANGSRTGFRSSSNGAQMVYGPNSIQQQQMLQMHNQSPPQPTYNSPHSYPISPSPSKMQPASMSNAGSPLMQQQQQQVVGNSQGVY